MIVLLCVLLVLIPIEFSDLPIPVFQAKSKVAKSLAVSRGEAYPFELLDKNFKLQQDKVAGCLWKPENPLASQVEVQLQFEPNSNLKSIRLSPVQSVETRECLHKVISKWNLPPNPTLRPFKYRIVLKN